jgi:hypothetical protein
MRIHSSGVPALKMLKLFVIVLPFMLPGSVDKVNLRLRVFSPAWFALSWTHLLALGQSGIIGCAKAFWSFAFFGTGLDIESVIVDFSPCCCGIGSYFLRSMAVNSTAIVVEVFGFHANVSFC